MSKKTYEQVNEMLDKSFNLADIAELQKARDLLCKAVEKAFVRGMHAGKVTQNSFLPEYPIDASTIDAVQLAQNAQIIDPDTLASLYAKEQGFKQ
jgi:hypothetical protein